MENSWIFLYLDENKIDKFLCCNKYENIICIKQWG